MVKKERATKRKRYTKRKKRVAKTKAMRRYSICSSDIANIGQLSENIEKALKSSDNLMYPFFQIFDQMGQGRNLP